MRRVLAFFILFIFIVGYAQEKKPTLMILPSDNWCESRYFMTTYDNMGMEVKTPNYQQAFVEDSELPLVISKIGGILTARGYSVKDAEMETKAVFARMAEDNLAMSKTSGATIAESPLDMIKRRAKMDIVIQIWWKVNKEPAGRSVSFILEAFDSYTSKRIATSSGTGSVSNEIVPVMLEQAVLEHLPEFDFQLMQYYQDMLLRGREIVMTVRLWDNWENDLETEYNGEELLDCIQEWLHDNAVNGEFNLSDATENFAQFEQIRIPLFDEKGKAVDARSFVTGLRKYLAKEPFEIPAKIMMRGLGEANLVLGEK
ncbi:MAG: hypothetical protein IKH24_03885 [Bacteroidales bacterium]|nr:hypothetical protein [Bacteroidales bacterium]